MMMMTCWILPPETPAENLDVAPVVGTGADVVCGGAVVTLAVDDGEAVVVDEDDEPLHATRTAPLAQATASTTPRRCTRPPYGAALSARCHPVRPVATASPWTYRLPRDQEANAATAQQATAKANASWRPVRNGPEINRGKKLRPVTTACCAGVRALSTFTGSSVLSGL